MRLSIIVPVLNEAATLRKFLQHVREFAPTTEIIVVDGDSDDGSFEVARGFADQVAQSPRGRARQMNVGAALARSDVVSFMPIRKLRALPCGRSMKHWLPRRLSVDVSDSKSLRPAGFIGSAMASEIFWSIFSGSPSVIADSFVGAKLFCKSAVIRKFQFSKTLNFIAASSASAGSCNCARKSGRVHAVTKR